MNCCHRDIECTEIDTSGMTKIECSECKNYSKRYACIASIPDRESMLEKTVESLRDQVDEIYVTLNDYNHIPVFLKDCKTVILDNSKGDAGKHYFAEQLEGYILTCDDDLIYPLGYVDKMIEGVNRYNCACTLHGRNYVKPIINFQQNFIGYPCLNTVITDKEVNVGGDGVMCYHTDFLKVKYSDFKEKNMSQLYFAKLCKEQGVKIMVLNHKSDYLEYQYPTWTIWDESSKNNFKEQTELLKSFLH
jgi:hypothetical protein